MRYLCVHLAVFFSPILITGDAFAKAEIEIAPNKCLDEAYKLLAEYKLSPSNLDCKDVTDQVHQVARAQKHFQGLGQCPRGQIYTSLTNEAAVCLSKSEYNEVGAIKAILREEPSSSSPTLATISSNQKPNLTKYIKPQIQQVTTHTSESTNHKIRTAIEDVELAQKDLINAMGVYVSPESIGVPTENQYMLTQRAG